MLNSFDNLNVSRSRGSTQEKEKKNSKPAPDRCCAPSRKSVLLQLNIRLVPPSNPCFRHQITRRDSPADTKIPPSPRFSTAALIPLSGEIPIHHVYAPGPSARLQTINHRGEQSYEESNLRTKGAGRESHRAYWNPTVNHFSFNPSSSHVSRRRYSSPLSATGKNASLSTRRSGKTKSA